MSYSTQLLLLTATVGSIKHREAVAGAEPSVADVLQSALAEIQQLVEAFATQRVTPTATHAFEQQLQERLRELGRQVAQWTYNHVEPAPAALPQHVWFEVGSYTRLNAKTPQHAWTLFGQIRLWRVGYRPTARSGDPSLFPLAMSLGLVHGATPALAERAALILAGTGSSQGHTLACLRRDHGVGWGVKKLRQVTGAIAAAMTEQRHAVQAQQVLDWLATATATTGKHKPVLSVGRDGITLGVRCRGGSVYEVAATATVTVLDRCGRRVGTVYLAHVPEPGQPTMSRQLTRLLREVLQRWQGPLPRLCYVTDAGDNETTYFNKVLRRLKHPRTGTPLDWIRVVDFYHASTRVWKLAEALFGARPRTAAWARKMLKWLRKPGGVNRVLHSAAALRHLYKLRGKRLEEFTKAYRYLRARMRFMDYARYQALGVPRGSGVTEAACKTVFTQRLKLSGMRWQRAGAQTILDLRVLLLSGVWHAAYARMLVTYTEPEVRGQRPPKEYIAGKAA